MLTGDGLAKIAPHTAGGDIGLRAVDSDPGCLSAKRVRLLSNLVPDTEGRDWLSPHLLLRHLHEIERVLDRSTVALISRSTDPSQKCGLCVLRYPRELSS